ncbi:MAG TPA: hypothetical protein DDY21_03680 [Candidatus Moranbacteria bacterium]|nr:hypothetical protein [Candidatus Moranbacteria bacterium]HCO99826.1 hypothetical protein [Candidatus Moranbacteria bacterium]
MKKTTIDAAAELKLKNFNKDSAVKSVSAIVGEFLNDNPELNFGISIHIASFKEYDLKEIDDDHAQRIMMQALRVKALSDKKVQERACSLVLRTHKRVKEIALDVSSTHVNAVCMIVSSNLTK